MEPFFLRLSNEVRHGLHHILGLIELTAEQPLSESQLHYLDRCRETADQLRREADDLTELARPEGLAADFTSFDASEAIGEIAGLMAALAERKGLSFLWTVDPGQTARIVGDKYLLQDMLRRLLDNAIRFTESGSVGMQVARCLTPSGDPALTFEITDTGTGIPPEVLEDFSGVVSQPRLQGLSLRILQKRLQGLHGSIAISPNLPHGTTIRVLVPVTPAAADPENVPSAEKPEKLYSRMPVRVLVAEDSDDSFLVFAAYGEPEGYQVSRAFNGAEAVEMAQTVEYDFIVMDVNMPRMDGYSAIRLIREWETEQRRPRIPILLLSADNLQRQMALGGAAGCSGHLTKPATKAQLLAALRYFSHAPQNPAQQYLH
jgi:CheY-like chemotaxis protein